MFVRYDDKDTIVYRSSDRLKKIKARHAHELADIKALEDQASEDLQQLKDTPTEQSDMENKSVVNIENDSDTVTTNRDSDVDMSDCDDTIDDKELQESDKESDEDGLDDMEDDIDTKDSENDDGNENDDNQDDEEVLEEEDNADKEVIQDEDGTKEGGTDGEKDTVHDGEEDNDDDNSNATPVKGSRYAPLGAGSGKSTKPKAASATDMYSSKKKKYRKGSTKSTSTTRPPANADTFLDGYKNPPYAHVLFYKLKAPIPSSETPTKTPHDAFSLVLQMLRQADESCVVFKFKDDTNRRHITTSKQIRWRSTELHGKYLV